MPFPTSAVLANAFVATAADPLPPGSPGHDLRPGTTTEAARPEPGPVTDVLVNGRRAARRLVAGKSYATPAKPLRRGTFRVLERCAPESVDWSISSPGGFAWFGLPDPFSDEQAGVG